MIYFIKLVEMSLGHGGRLIFILPLKGSIRGILERSLVANVETQVLELIWLELNISMDFRLLYTKKEVLLYKNTEKHCIFSLSML
ncbi:hypothetical protein [Streptococcus jiangjianxini]|uniref:hypothetical protein n=1 Tax=Streptococcus jiangjianxini TaxID=3161189 RepID=UPI0032EAD85E